jgi:hypothetical protein
MSIEDEIKAMNDLPTTPPEEEPLPEPELAPEPEPTPGLVPEPPPEPGPEVEPAPEPPAPEPAPGDAITTETSLRAEIARLAALVGAPSTVAPPEPQALAPQAPVAPQAPAPTAAPEVIKFVETEEQFNQILDNVDNFNKFLTQVVRGVHAQAVSEAREATLVSIPSLVGNLADQAVNMRLAVRDFFTGNPDLQPYNKYVGFVANEIAAREPELPLDQLFEKLGPEVRSRLRLVDAASLQAPPSPGAGPGAAPPAEPPAFPPTAGGPRKPSGADVKLSKMEKEILDMIEATGGQ